MLSGDEPVILSRGGILFPTSAGMVQFGAVPETIKDTMMLPGGVPTTYVVPSRLFSVERGISLAELEFPAYYHFFLKRGKILIVCRREQRAVVETVLREGLFGPPRFDPYEFAGSGRRYLPDLSSELAHFRKNPFNSSVPMEIEDLARIVEFDSDGKAEIGAGVTVALGEDNGISILEKGRQTHQWRGDPPLPSPPTKHDGPLRAFRGPLLGVSVLGSGHGFSPIDRTSGFIVWVEGTGVMVDPPVDWADWLLGYDITAKQIDTLILTHCHADHDAGTLQKIMQEGRITIYTTPTVLTSFVSKYSALTGLSPEAFRDLFDHVPVSVGEPLYLHGAEATFSYSLHSIPCAGFEIRLGDKSLVYPSDTLNDPAAIRALYEKGVVSRDRRDELLSFPWHHNLVLHEAGIPPIHTPVGLLADMGDEVKRRTLLLHTSMSTLPENSGLRIAKTGLENTVDLEPTPSPMQEGLRRLDAMARVEILSVLPCERSGEFLRMARRQDFQAGEQLIKTGSMGQEFFIILSGLVSVQVGGKEIKVYSAFDYFGETSLILEQPRIADVIAKTAVETVVLSRAHFLHLIRDTALPEQLARLARRREQKGWQLLESSPVFCTLSANQKNQLEGLMDLVTLAKGEAAGTAPMLIAEGQMEVERVGFGVTVLSGGGLAGDVTRLIREEPSRFAFTALTEVRGFRFEQGGLRRFLIENPGAYLKLADLSSGWEERALLLARAPGTDSLL